MHGQLPTELTSLKILVTVTTNYWDLKKLLLRFLNPNQLMVSPSALALEGARPAPERDREGRDSSSADKHCVLTYLLTYLLSTC